MKRLIQNIKEFFRGFKYKRTAVFMGNYNGTSVYYVLYYRDIDENYHEYRSHRWMFDRTVMTQNDTNYYSCMTLKSEMNPTQLFWDTIRFIAESKAGMNNNIASEAKRKYKQIPIPK